MNALAVYAGSLYAAGQFTHAGANAAANIGRWNGATWVAVGGGSEERVLALCLHSVNGQSVLTAAGDSVFRGSSIRFWDGAAWTHPDESFVSGSWIGAVGSFDTGSGPELYASGGFGNGAMSYLARWSAALGWRAAGDGLTTVAWAFLPFDDGRGPALFVAGDLTVVNLPDTEGIARWDGSAWSTVGGGLGGFGEGRALAVYDDGSGPALYIGGSFESAGATTAANIAKWDGHAWAALGTGISGPVNSASVRALAVFDDGSGPALYAAGIFTGAGGHPASNIARWRGGSWSPVGTGLSGDVYALAAFDPDGAGPAPAGLYAAGALTSAGGVPVAHIAVWAACPRTCYANCDGSMALPVLNVNDFICFQNRFAAGEAYANCDGSTAPPVLNVNDFVCFQAQFASGCR